MSHITTYTGLHFDPINPKEEWIRNIDIAHALSLICRGNGHMKHFYSVAQHSINCAKEAKEKGFSLRVQLGCLLHDASEAYLSDVTRPVKKLLPQYLEVENRLQEMIWNHWLHTPLSTEEKKQVFEVDDILFYHEFWQLMGEKKINPLPVIQSEPELGEISFQQVEQEFLERLEALSRVYDMEAKEKD